MGRLRADHSGGHSYLRRRQGIYASSSTLTLILQLHCSEGWPIDGLITDLSGRPAGRCRRRREERRDRRRGHQLRLRHPRPQGGLNRQGERP